MGLYIFVRVLRGLISDGVYNWEKKNPSKQTLAGLSNVVIIGIQNKKSCKRGAYIREGLISGCIFMFTD